MIESCFKGVGRSLRQAIRREGRIAEHQGRAVSALDVVIVASGGANTPRCSSRCERLGARS